MSTFIVDQETTIKIVNKVINYFKNVNDFEKTEYEASYLENNSLIKKTRKAPHIAFTDEIVKYCGDTPYSGDNIYIKRIVNNKNNLKTISATFKVLKCSGMDIYLVKSHCFTKTDIKISDLTKKVLSMSEEDIYKYFEVIKCSNEKVFLKADLQTNETKIKEGFYMYNFVLVDNNGNTSVSVPFALVSSRQFSKRGKDSLIGKFYHSYKYEKQESKTDEVLYYINTIYDFKKQDYKKVFEFPLSFYTEKSHEIPISEIKGNDYPSPVSVNFELFENKEEKMDKPESLNELDAFSLSTSVPSIIPSSTISTVPNAIPESLLLPNSMVSTPGYNPIPVTGVSSLIGTALYPCTTSSLNYSLPLSPINSPLNSPIQMDTNLDPLTQSLMTNSLLASTVVSSPLMTNSLLTSPIVSSPLMTSPIIPNPVIPNSLISNPIIPNPIISNPSITMIGDNQSSIENNDILMSLLNQNMNQNLFPNLDNSLTDINSLINENDVIPLNYQEL